ncbi:MAG: hypothetical protein HY689_12970 [Chloroflexi bacterium]|nr:hypothetical protein [Chloroflexota bacterium]
MSGDETTRRAPAETVPDPQPQEEPASPDPRPVEQGQDDFRNELARAIEQRWVDHGEPTRPIGAE